LAVLAGARVLARAEVAMRGRDEERLMPAVADALSRAELKLAALDAIVCGGGPGSFTSLRIAGSLAKGLATASGRPLVAVPSLALVAARAPVPEAPRPERRILATMDAMRGDRYAALVTLRDAASPSAFPAAGEAASTRGTIVVGYAYLGVVPADEVGALAERHEATACDAATHAPDASGVGAFGLALGGATRGAAGALVVAPVALGAWEPDYGRKAEAQVVWEGRHGRALPADPGVLEATVGSAGTTRGEAEA
jgi:tRNA threonylcarbamoyladenosine biosynthesis protein TsaB